MYFSLKRAYILALLSFCLANCHQDNIVSDETITVRLTREPDQLNPILSSTGIAATVENLLFLPLMDYDPYTQEYIPVLAEKRTEYIKQGNNTGFKIKIREQAVWDDKTPITAQDILFTLKTMLNPFVESSGKRSVIEPIDSVELLPNPRELIFWTNDNYFLDEQSFTNSFFIQESKYDSTLILRSLSWNTLKNMNALDTVSIQNKQAINFATQFADPRFGREQAIGCGPYLIDQWVTNQYIKLKRKPDWWGNKIPRVIKDSVVNLSNNPDEIMYRIIPEEANAVAALRDGLLDVIAGDISPSMFTTLKEDSSLQSKLNFISGPPIRYVYISMNTRSPFIDDFKTRQALAHLLDLDQLRANLFKGYAQRIAAPFQPSKSYYARDLSPVAYNLDTARSLLKAAGWKDSNHNGILDKNILQKVRDFKVRLFVSPGGLGQQVGIHFQEQARKVGIEIELISKPIQLTLQQLHNHDFELAALSDSQFPGPDDPYDFWHSESYTSGGQNYTGFGSPQTDSIINKIRHGDPGAERTQLYHQLQEVIYQQQPAIFLFAPQNLIIVNKRWTAKPGSVRPGYFVNHFKLNKQ
ncbi:MAG: ABC transporter substrate-binding protein [Saprospiraceae bacterium]